MTCLIIKSPPSNYEGRRYILDIMITNWLGLKYEQQFWSKAWTEISLPDPNTGSLIMPDTFFSHAGQHWLTSRSLPARPLPWSKWNDPGRDVLLNYGIIPILYGCEAPDQTESSWQRIHPYLWEDRENVYLGIDIFGSAFFMLTRYEEYVKPNRDQHDRFPAGASLAYQEGFLNRPIINEYLEILWQQMHKLWPGLKRKPRRFRTLLSHDVDFPWKQVGTGLCHLTLGCGGDILKRKSPVLAIKRARSWQAVRKGRYRQDQNYTFDRIMDISEKNSIKSSFYFKTGCSNSVYDHFYDINHPYMRQLFREIYERGHEIGLHPSYDTYLSAGQIKTEFQKLRQVCSAEGIQQNTWGGRQHFLRWQVSATWRNWVEAGLNYDSTLTYSEQAGFRCGVCYEFTVFDLQNRKKLALVERPLIVMEVSVTQNQEKYPSGNDVFDCMNTLRQSCRKYNGDFTLLWHNNNLNSVEMWEIYERLVDGAHV